MSATRVYLVRDRLSAAEVLVRAPSQAQALRHIVDDQFSVEVATQEQIIAWLGEGHGDVETAGDPRRDRDDAPAGTPDVEHQLEPETT